ncbi:hypothetical protein E0Z10_g9405 [Xylaria hypoxylon]|uniref:C2H2-type domain-containing protein n=1 Tax=Xylaria hypoxylon TaxID=37992 RepID=A0A4Z0YP15_9PEZI|nr:hypothetical protein E0Z10_g9405 [Xylaria hypoxylon]
MDQDEFTSAFNEYLFSASNYEDSYPATIDPALLQTSASAFDFHVEQEEQPAQPFGSDPGPSAQYFSIDDAASTPPNTTAGSSSTASTTPYTPPAGVHPFSSLEAPHEHMGPSYVKQHSISSKSPFKCHCDKEFKSLYTLQRHIRGADKALVPEHPCPECIFYQGKNGFRRKDNLVQHLRFFHKYDDDQLATLFPPRQTRMLNIPVCHYVSCEYYRGPDFKDLGIRDQEKNRPFHKQSDYTTHMKREHDWSPHPCKVPGCSKLDGKGFFSATALEKHCKEKHPGIAATVLNSQNRMVKEARTMNGTDAKGKLHATIAMSSFNARGYRAINRMIAKGKLYATIAMSSCNARSYRAINGIIAKGKLHASIAMSSFNTRSYRAMDKMIAKGKLHATIAMSSCNARSYRAMNWMIAKGKLHAAIAMSSCNARSYRAINGIIAKGKLHAAPAQS